MENSISSKHPELVTEWSPRNLPIVPESVSYGSNKLYWWKGPCGHEWQTSPKARSAGEKCPICANARIVPGINDMETLAPDLAKEWSEKNDQLKPSMIGVGSHKKVIWKGKCGHEWSAVVRNRVAGAGCPYCSHNIVLPGFNDLETMIPEVAAEWSDKNLPLLPSQVTAYANKRVWWKCSQGHEWYTLISTRSYGSKCPYCSGIKTLKGFNDFETRFPELAKEWSDKNGELKPNAINEKCRLNVWWKCPTCGNEWKSVVGSRVKGTICPVCADRSVLRGYNDLATTNKELMPEWDFELNTSIQPSNISKHSKRRAWWRCRFGHSWNDTIYNRAIVGCGCKVCEEEFKLTLPQLLIMLYCREAGFTLRLDDEKTLGIMIDAYIPELNLAFSVVGKGTKTEIKTAEVLSHLCSKRHISHEVVSSQSESEQVCFAIKRGFSNAHYYIHSDNCRDVERARKAFWRLRNNSLTEESDI